MCYVMTGEGTGKSWACWTYCTARPKALVAVKWSSESLHLARSPLPLGGPVPPICGFRAVLHGLIETVCVIDALWLHLWILCSHLLFTLVLFAR